MASLKGKIRSSMMLWFNASAPGAADQLNRFLVCRQALDDLLDGKLCFCKYIDLLNSHGVDIEDYMDTVWLNFQDLV